MVLCFLINLYWLALALWQAQQLHSDSNETLFVSCHPQLPVIPAVHHDRQSLTDGAKFLVCCLGCCCSGVSGNAPTIAVRILERLPQEDT